MLKNFYGIYPGKPNTSHATNADPSWQGYTKWRYRQSIGPTP
jgi:hypothetical protein